jgi:hypothetical protein
MSAPRAALDVAVALAVASGALAAPGCGGGERPARASPPARAPFIALERDFQGFRLWEAIPLPTRAPSGITHLAGRRTEYLNARPAAGTRTYPVGTILVKEIDAGAPEGHQLVAMVKRGGGYNARGARGWEWFELRDRGDGSVGIVWRGLNAPDGESYGGDPLGGCNACHEMAAADDYVKATALARAR